MRSVFVGLAIFVLLVFSGCSGGGDSSQSEFAVEGKVVGVGPIENAKVCLDLNKNYSCDSDEPSATTNRDGSYLLQTDTDDTNNILAIMTKYESYDRATDRQLKYDMFFATTTNAPNLSIFSTISTLYMADKGYSDINQSSSAVSELVFDEALNLLDSDILSENILVSDVNLYLIHWFGIKLEWLKYGYLDSLNMTDVNSELVEIFKSHASKLSEKATNISRVVSSTFEPTSDSISRSLSLRSSSEKQYTWSPGMEYGRGFSDVTNSILQGSQCLKSFDTSWWGSQSELYDFKLIKSELDLSKSLNISGSISLGYEMISGKISGLFMDAFTNNESSVFLLLKYRYTSGTYNVDNAIIKDLEQGLYKDDRDKFREKCGDKYLVSATFGGSFYGLLEIKTSSATEKKDIEVSLEGSYDAGVTSLEVEGDFSQSLNALTSKYQVTAHVGSVGGSSTQIEVTDLESLKVQGKSFIDKTQEDCTKDSTECYFLANFARYEVIAGNGQEISETAKLQKKMMPIYDDAINKLELLKPKFDFIKNNKFLFASKYQTASYLMGIANDIHLAQTAVSAHAAKCESDGNCKELTEFLFKDDGVTSNLAEDIDSELPSLGMLAIKNCSEYIKYNHQKLAADTVTLYIKRDLDKDFRAYCDNNDTYLTLSRHSTSNRSLRHNYFIASHLKGEDVNGTTIVTRYEKIKVDVQEDRLLIDSKNNKYSTTSILSTGDDNLSALFYNDPQYGNTLVDFVTFGSVYNEKCPTNTTTKTTTTVEYKTIYKYVGTPMTWENAKIYADEYGEGLVTIKSSEDQLAVEDAYHNQNNNRSNTFWIGLSQKELTKDRHKAQSQFGWIDEDGFVDGYSYFGSRKTDLRGQREAQCYVNPRKFSQWDCDYYNNSRPFMMKLKVGEITTHTQEVENNTTCDNPRNMGQIDLAGSKFKISDDNLYSYGDLEDDIQSSLKMDEQSIKFSNPYKDSNEQWSVQAGDVELIYDATLSE